jgi:hypothetical protein
VATSLPYLASPGSIKTALERIRAAATPDRVTTDFVHNKLLIKGGTGRAIIPYLKKIGFVNSDGTPTETYKRFRSVSSGDTAAAEAVRTGYKELGQVNESFYELKDAELLDLIVQVTGVEPKSSAARQTLGTLKFLRAFANFEKGAAPELEHPPELPPEPAHETDPKPAKRSPAPGINLGYTINLNLPATSDQAVFNAIFRSLKEHLISEKP